MTRILMMSAAALAWAAPLTATPSLSEPANPPPANSEAADAALARYGQWLVRLGEIERPVQEQLVGLGAEWRTAQGDVERFRASIARALAVIDRSRTELQALPLPDLSGLDLPEDIRPARIVHDVLRLNSEIRRAAESFNPLLDAEARGDRSAAMAAFRQLMGSLKLVMDSHVVMTRASLATTPREDSAWESTNVQLLYFRIGSRTLESWPLAMAGRHDPSLSRDLSDLADELEATARAGGEKIGEKIEYFEGEATAAGDDVAYAQTARRMSAVLTIDRKFFPLGMRLAEITRLAATRFEGRPLVLDTWAGFFRELQGVRLQMEALAAEEAEALAGGN